MGLSLGVVLTLLVVFAAGAGLSFQAPINAVMARAAGGLAMAACISFLFGFLVLAIYTVLRGDWPPPATILEAPWYVWVAGSFGILYIVSTTWAVPQVGVLTTLTAAILGQMVAAVVVDRMGAFGLPVHEITWPRIMGIVLVMCGLVLTKY